MTIDRPNPYSRVDNDVGPGMVCPKHGAHSGADCPEEWLYAPYISRQDLRITQQCPKGLSWPVLRPPWFLTRWWRRVLWSAGTA